MTTAEIGRRGLIDLFARILDQDRVDLGEDAHKIVHVVLEDRSLLPEGRRQ